MRGKEREKMEGGDREGGKERVEGRKRESERRREREDKVLIHESQSMRIWYRDWYHYGCVFRA